jgi:hypothetical protein
MGTRWDGSHLSTSNPCAPDLPSAHLPPQAELTEDADHATGQASFEAETHHQSRRRDGLGATGLGFSLLGSASASTMPAADIAQSDNTSPDQRFVLSEEEMADVSLATFHLFDKENVGRGVQLARGCGGCRGCAARGCRACAVRGCAVRGCAVGCAAGSCCASWGYCRVC